MIISVASGKGGTGKTTIATNLALSISSDEILDCDIEAANVSIFLKPKIHFEKKLSALLPFWISDKCKATGECVKACEFNAIALIKNKVLIFPDLCHNCGACIIACPNNALIKKDLEYGKLYKGKIERNNILYISGMQYTGKKKTVSVIREIKKQINPSDIVIIDAPPGNAHPVIASVYGSDFVILVAQPTPFSLSDLEKAINLLRLLKIPFAVVINRYNLDKEGKFKLWLKNQGIDILLEIEDDIKIAKAYSEGKLLIDIYPEYKDKFLHLLKKIKEKLAINRSL